jgi:hypothetical protein
MLRALLRVRQSRLPPTSMAIALARHGLVCECLPRRAADPGRAPEVVTTWHQEAGLGALALSNNVTTSSDDDVWTDVHGTGEQAVSLSWNSSELENVHC